MNFIAGRHNLCHDSEGNVIFGTDGNVIVEDTVLKCTLSVPLTQEAMDFFGLQFRVCEEGAANLPSTSNKVPVATNSTQVAVWNEEKEKALIETWKKHKTKFSNTQYKSADVWRCITSDLNSSEHTDYTAKQVENKWKNLRKNYMTYVDSAGPKNSGGEPLKKPKHFHSLEEIFRKNPQVEPVSIASSRRSPAPDDFSDEPDLPTSVSDDGIESAKKPAKVRKLTRVQKELSTLAEKMQEQSEKREEVRGDRFNTLFGVYNRMAHAQEAVATSVGQLTQFLITRGQQQQ